MFLWRKHVHLDWPIKSLLCWGSRDWFFGKVLTVFEGPRFGPQHPHIFTTAYNSSSWGSESGFWLHLTHDIIHEIPCLKLTQASAPLRLPCSSALMAPYGGLHLPAVEFPVC